jgi:C4-dicarboxylate-specific signal transduction histidine kinase
VDGSLEELRVANTQRLELYANSLNSEIGHYARLPSLLGCRPMWKACCTPRKTASASRLPMIIWNG